MPITITEAAKRTGLPAATIRIWETRYGWPRPRRSAGGYRVFSRGDVDLLRRVKALVDTGTPVGSILMDGAPSFPTRDVERKPRPSVSFDGIPQPATARGQAIRAELEAAIAKGDRRHIEMARHLLPTIHPADRDNAVLAVLKVAGVGCE